MGRVGLTAILAALAGSLAAPAAAVTTVMVQETAANVANLKKLIGAPFDVTFVSELPGQAEADSLTAFGKTKMGESALIVEGGANLQKLEPVKEVAYYDDAGMTKLSDLVVLYEDNAFRYAIGYSSDTAPEPAAWAMMLAGLGLAGAALRARSWRARVAP